MAGSAQPQQNKSSEHQDGQTARMEQNIRSDGDGRSRQGGASQNKKDGQIARALGIFSIGLGLAEIVAPYELAKLIGVSPRPVLFRLLGARELASGIGILAGGNKPAAPMWSRVAGDAMDLVLLGAALSSPSAKKGRLAAATAAIAGVTVLDLMCSQNLSQRIAPEGKNEIERSVTIGKSADELYRLWRAPETLPQLMQQFVQITPTSATRARWKINAPLGQSIEWDAELTDDRAGEFVGWKAADGAPISNEGSIEFRPAPGDRGTVATLRLRFAPPGGAIGTAAANLFDFVPEKIAAQALRSFRSLAETGEIPTLVKNPSARGKGDAL